MCKLVEAKSIEDYLEKYYKKSRFTDTLIETYKTEFNEYGYVCTSHHDNVTGEFICWPKHPEWDTKKE
jgi:hypothetical protein